VAPTPEKKPETTIKEYSKVITKDAITDEGLFTVHVESIFLKSK
jgi:hypothetical protein